METPEISGMENETTQGHYAPRTTYSDILKFSLSEDLIERKSRKLIASTVEMSAGERDAWDKATSLLGATKTAAMEGSSSRKLPRFATGGDTIKLGSSTAVSKVGSARGVFTSDSNFENLFVKTSDVVGEEEKSSGHHFVPLHKKLLAALNRGWHREKSRSILGATVASAEGTKSRKYSGSSSGVRESCLSLGMRESDDDLVDAVTPAQALDSEKTKPAWKPSLCPMRYATLYPSVEKTPSKRETEINFQPAEQSEKETIILDAMKRKWCGCCMRAAFDPYYLPCGHGFCRRCIVDTNFFLLRDNAEAVKDPRAVMRCPLLCCKAVIRCLPLINGDFRFHLVRPEDKVKPKESALNLCEQHRLHTYKIRADVDVTKRKSDNLFDGFDDVVVIP